MDQSLYRIIREQRFIKDVPSILGYDPVSIGKHFSNKLISRRSVVVGKPCSLFCFFTGGLKKNTRFLELEMYDKISLYRFPHISYGNSRINKRTISPGARGNVKAVIISLIIKKGERRKVFHLTPSSIAMIL
jgi:hypothetical protein